MARIVTGSVADIKAPNRRLSKNENVVARCSNILVTPNIMPATVKVEIVVPTKAKVKIAPMFRKKKRFFMLDFCELKKKQY